MLLCPNRFPLSTQNRIPAKVQAMLLCPNRFPLSTQTCDFLCHTQTSTCPKVQAMLLCHSFVTHRPCTMLLCHHTEQNSCACPTALVLTLQISFVTHRPCVPTDFLCPHKQEFLHLSLMSLYRFPFPTQTCMSWSAGYACSCVPTVSFAHPDALILKCGLCI